MAALRRRGVCRGRGQSAGQLGPGREILTAIWADWGNKDGQDVLAAVDYAVAQGVADSTRLGVGGWSYGGILTDQVIARDRRFKAAISGAGQGNASPGTVPISTSENTRRSWEHRGETPRPGFGCPIRSFMPTGS